MQKNYHAFSRLATAAAAGAGMVGWLDWHRRRHAGRQCRAGELELDKCKERLRLIAEISRELLEARTQEGLLQGIFEKLSPSLSVDVFLNFMADEPSQVLELHSWAGISEDVARGISCVPFGQAVCGTVAQRRVTIVAARIQQSSDPKVQPYRQLGIRAYACIPLLVDHRFSGTVGFGSRTVDEFAPEDVAFFQTITDHAALALDRLSGCEALRESERRFLQIARSIDQVFWLLELEPKERIVYVSPAWERLWQRSPGELYVHPRLWLEAICPADRPAVEQSFTGWLAAGCPGRWEVEYRLKLGPGGERWIHDSAAAVLDPASRVRRIAGIAADITERKCSEEALRLARQEAQNRAQEAEEHEQILKALMEHLPMGIAIADAPEVSIRMVSRSGREFLAWCREEIAGHELPAKYDIYHADGTTPAMPEELPLSRAVRKGELVREEEWVVRHGDGSKVPVLCTAAPILDRNGCVRGGVIGWQDITERRQAEAALRQSERRYRRLFEANLAGVYLSRPDGTIIDFNDAMMRMVGYDSREELMRQRAPDFYVDPQFRQELLRQLCAEGVVRGREALLRRKDGSLLYALGAAALLTDEQTGEPYIQGVAIDITKRKQAEDASRRAQEQVARINQNLERTVVERTARLQEMVGDLEHFSYTITHDMRAPLRAIQGFAAMLLDRPDDCAHPATRDYIQRILEASARMDHLIIDALDYSKVIRQDMPLEAVDTGALLRGIIESYPQFQPPHAEIKIDGPLPVVLANEAGLTQCFSNLLGNAVKFVEPGKTPQVRVWAELREEGGARREDRGSRIENGGKERSNKENIEHRSGDSAPSLNSQLSTLNSYVRLWFEDNGIGIRKDCQGRIFAMFQRINKDYEGTGIGLALVKKVVERMGGKVGVESELGRGSRFWVELKLFEHGGLRVES